MDEGTTIEPGFLENKGVTLITNSQAPPSDSIDLQNSEAQPPSAPHPIPTFPPPKTDKPRPHVCLTCTRSFARLEHLKRHERSHTKEKPFQCMACSRCFARRDLLLRHQQKLHSATTPPCRQRAARRESAAAGTGKKVRKNSIAQFGQARPRANTLSHVDANTLEKMVDMTMSGHFVPGHGHHSSMNGMQNLPNFGFRGIGSSTGLPLANLPRLDTSSISVGMGGGLRTAPLPTEYDFDHKFGLGGDFSAQSNTIDPHALHRPSLSGLGIDGTQPFDYGNFLDTSQVILEDDCGFDWTSGRLDQQTMLGGSENAIESSPSALDSNSPATFDSNGNLRASYPGANKVDRMWQQSLMNNQQAIQQSPSSVGMSAMFTDVGVTTETDPSPKSLIQNNLPYDMAFMTPPNTSYVEDGLINPQFSLPFRYGPASSTASLDSSLRHSSVATNCGELITEHIRSMTLSNLSKFSGFGNRRQSAPMISSPLSPEHHSRGGSVNVTTFPSTPDLQRYASAYFRFCHPHLPFLHLPTLNFESREYSASRRNSYYNQASPIGGSCLLLSLCAIGAMYENELSISRELFEHAKRTISSYLEGRRRSTNHRTPLVAPNAVENDDTPLWLIQAMLLNVVYGNNCGDKISADLANNHCAALVSLARGAELAKPYFESAGSEVWSGITSDPVETEWLNWKMAEERKRTLYSIFVLSSMMVIAYNRPPALTNSEIRLDLPCDEEFWTAESAFAWRSLGGLPVLSNRCIPFANALTYLLTAAQREKRMHEQMLIDSNAWNQPEPDSELRPSTFGCLVLIDALHNYIYETRQRHLGRQWTNVEVEAMYAHIEPALRAWTASYSSNPAHIPDRPNPFVAGPLPSDSIPLLDLAYVRLYVDFGRSKEAYWARDYDGMVLELAKGPETGFLPPFEAQSQLPGMPPTPQSQCVPTPAQVDIDGHNLTSQPSRRERHLRKAAFYAADHLVNSTLVGAMARDLPMQSILCACDSAQVLAEWVTTLQERVGMYIGILGADDANVHDVPGTIMLDDQDRSLLVAIRDFLHNAEARTNHPAALQEIRKAGYGARILLVTSQNLARVAAWPVTRLMAQSLEIQSRHVAGRVSASVPQAG